MCLIIHRYPADLKILFINKYLRGDNCPILRATMLKLRILQDHIRKRCKRYAAVDSRIVYSMADIFRWKRVVTNDESVFWFLPNWHVVCILHAISRRCNAVMVRILKRYKTTNERWNSNLVPEICYKLQTIVVVFTELDNDRMKNTETSK